MQAPVVMIAVRDIGLLESAVHRPRASVFGQDAYPELQDKAAALLHSLARTHPLVDGTSAWRGSRPMCSAPRTA